MGNEEKREILRELERIKERGGSGYSGYYSKGHYDAIMKAIRAVMGERDIQGNSTII